VPDILRIYGVESSVAWPFMTSVIQMVDCVGRIYGPIIDAIVSECNDRMYALDLAIGRRGEWANYFWQRRGPVRESLLVVLGPRFHPRNKSNHCPVGSVVHIAVRCSNTFLKGVEAVGTVAQIYCGRHFSETGLTWARTWRMVTWTYPGRLIWAALVEVIHAPNRVTNVICFMSGSER